MEIIALDDKYMPKHYPVVTYIEDYRVFAKYVSEVLNTKYPDCNFIFLIKGTSGAIISSLVYDNLINLISFNHEIKIVQADKSMHRKPFYKLKSLLQLYPLGSKQNKYIVLDDLSASGATVNYIVRYFRNFITKNDIVSTKFNNKSLLDAYISATDCIIKEKGIDAIPWFPTWKNRFKTVMAFYYRE